MLDFLQKPKQEIENYWALLIESEWITSAVWHINDKGEVEIVATAPPTRWENNLLEAVDISLSACSQKLSEDVSDPTKTVFGLPNTWIENGNVKDEKLQELKSICDNLSLTPSGFVVLSEAISHLLKEEDKSSLNSMLIGISDQNLEISIYNLGVLAGVTIVSRSVSIDDDVTEGLTRLGEGLTNFPSKIILYNQMEQELEELKEVLNNSDWTKIGNSKFVHTPQIEIFDPNKKIFAVALAGGSELGAVKGVEETKVDELPLEEVANVEEPNEITAKDLGFVQDEPVPVKKIELPSFHITRPNIKVPKLHFKFNLLNNNRFFVILFSSFIAMLIIGFAFWWFYPKAIVNIYVSPKKIEENLELSLDSDLKLNDNKSEVNGEKTITTTGTKTVGDKAKGKVKVQNGTAFPINLPSGSILVSTSDLKFVTAETASISGALSPSSPGVAEIDVIAASIGSEYNIGKDEIFKVANYPKAEVDATTLDTFSGGSSRQISAVSDDDRRKILNELTEELVDQAKKELKDKIDSDQLLIDSSIEIDSKTEDFSNKVGDEASSLKLTLELEINILSVSKSELGEKSQSILKDKIPQGFILRDDQIKYEIESNEEYFDVLVVANLLPDIDNQEIAKKIVGKYPKLAEDYFLSIPGFVKAEFKIKPMFPGKMGTLPHVVKNMTINFVVDQ